jgi:hypothetical protein
MGTRVNLCVTSLGNGRTVKREGYSLERQIREADI